MEKNEPIISIKALAMAASLEIVAIKNKIAAINPANFPKVSSI